MRLSQIWGKIKTQKEKHLEDLILSFDVLFGLSCIALLWVSLFPYLNPLWVDKGRSEAPSPSSVSSKTLFTDGGPALQVGGEVNSSNVAEGSIVASKKGTKYHLISCPSGKTIKEENRIYFQSVHEARRAGYLPASNCPGL